MRRRSESAIKKHFLKEVLFYWLLYQLHEFCKVFEEHLYRYGKKYDTEKFSCYIYASFAQQTLQKSYFRQYYIHDHYVE